MIAKYRQSKIGEKNPMFGKEGTLKGKFGSEHPSSKKVERVDILTGEVISYASQKIAAEMNNIKKQVSYKCVLSGKAQDDWRFRVAFC
jgi:hypothetical protein